MKEIKYKITKKGLKSWRLNPRDRDILSMLEGRQAKGLTRQKISERMKADWGWSSGETAEVLKRLLRKNKIERGFISTAEKPKTPLPVARLPKRKMPRITPKRPRLRR